MTDRITFFLPGRPRPKNQRHVGRGGKIFTDPKQRAHQNDLCLQAKLKAPDLPWEGAITLCLDFIFPPPKKPRPHQAIGSPHTQKPDADNLAKMIKDSLTGAEFWDDDCQVSDMRITKRWGDPAGTMVQVIKHGEGDGED